jgi:hypothetical protein
MAKTTTLRSCVAFLITFGALGTTAQAQFFGMGAGSTLQGDYLRGVGFAAWGEGVYNLYTAQANSINTDTYIRWNEYVQDCYKLMSKEYNERNRAIMAKTTLALKQRRERYRNNPHELDLMTGNALYMLLEELRDPKISESSFRSVSVPLPVDMIRKIPFKLNERNEKFSMERLSVRGKGKWPVALQGEAFALYRKAYERAVDKALEQALEGKAEIATIEKIGEAVDGLRQKLREVVRADDQRAQSEAVVRLDELEATVRQFKTHGVQMALAEIDKYSGTTVYDLKAFMQKYNLQFAEAKTPEERMLYLDLYTALKLQADKFVNAGAIAPEQ